MQPHHAVVGRGSQPDGLGEMFTRARPGALMDEDNDADNLHRLKDDAVPPRDHDSYRKQICKRIAGCLKLTTEWTSWGDCSVNDNIVTAMSGGPSLFSTITLPRKAHVRRHY